MDEFLARLLDGSRSRSRTPDVQSIADRIDDLSDALHDYLPHRARAPRGRRFARSARRRGEAGLEALEEGSLALRRHAGRTVREHPAVSLGMVLGFGLVLGILLSRR